MGAADRAVQYARNWLLATAPGSRIHDVQDDPRFQHRGVDLLWELPTGEVRGIEVKGDRQPKRKRYFFELVSNLERDTPGCFLYSGADLLVYVFLAQGELHVLPLKAVRAAAHVHADGGHPLHDGGGGGAGEGRAGGGAGGEVHPPAPPGSTYGSGVRGRHGSAARALRRAGAHRGRRPLLSPHPSPSGRGTG
jgi:hypothetical protein